MQLASEYRGILEITPLLREIQRKLPTIDHPFIYQTVAVIHQFLLRGSLPEEPKPGIVPVHGSISRDLLDKLIETLRCCHVAPKGWPQPPSEGALIIGTLEWLPGYGEAVIYTEAGRGEA